jgi:hypothetical protein
LSRGARHAVFAPGVVVFCGSDDCAADVSLVALHLSR